MADPRVVILSSRSLFVEGVAKRLKQHLPENDVQLVDARQANALEQVIAAQPTSVILDATDADVYRNCPLSKLLNILPLIKVIRLDPQQDKIQIVISEQRSVDQVSDLIEVIQSAGTDQPTSESSHTEERGGEKR